MAKINIQEIIDHMENDMRKSLDATMREHFPDQDFNSRAVYKSFLKQVNKRCRIWETIPNKYIKSQ